jgi:hypothetical protein
LIVGDSGLGAIATRDLGLNSDSLASLL